MNDEIKEILSLLNSSSWSNEAKQIEDYITNLQEQLHQASLDIQELTERDIWCPSWCDKLTNLQEKVNQYENPDDLTLFYMWLDEKAKDKMKALQEERNMYKNGFETMSKNYFEEKSKNEKAREYINTHYLNANEPELLNILQGEDKK